jgi:hypothetical protein
MSSSRYHKGFLVAKTAAGEMLEILNLPEDQQSKAFEERAERVRRETEELAAEQVQRRFAGAI